MASGGVILLFFEKQLTNPKGFVIIYKISLLYTLDIGP